MGDTRASAARWFVATAVTVTLVSPAPARAARCTLATERNRYGTWTTIPLPKTPRAEIPDTEPPLQDDSYDVDSFAVDLHAASTIYVADAWTVMRSTDGGCHWSKSFSILDGDDIASKTDRIVSLTRAPASSPTRVYALIRGGGVHPLWVGQPSSAVAPRLAVLDRSGEWRLREPVLAGTGAPIVGDAGRLWAGARPGRLYMTVNDLSGSTLYASEDDGATWEPRGIPTIHPYELNELEGVTTCAAEGLCAGVRYDLLVPDPLDPDVLWTATANTVLRSEDAGRTWRAVHRRQARDNLALCVSHAPGRAATIVLLAASEMAWSSDGGTSWRTRLLVRVPSYGGLCAGPGACEIVYTDSLDNRARMIRGGPDVDVSLASHGAARASSTRLTDATYVPSDGSYLFLGGDTRGGGLRWGKAMLRFAPKRGTAP